MRVVLQRVSKASVSVDSKSLGEINQGFLLLVGFTSGDGDKEIDYLVKKISQLRVFTDEEGKMNLNIQAIEGEILSVSQFTLYADTKKGNRPSFVKAGDPVIAEKLYNQFNQKLAMTGIPIQTGEFGGDMTVSLVNDGPVTIIFDTEQG